MKTEKKKNRSADMFPIKKTEHAWKQVLFWHSGILKHIRYVGRQIREK